MSETAWVRGYEAGKAAGVAEGRLQALEEGKVLVDRANLQRSLVHELGNKGLVCDWLDCSYSNPGDLVRPYRPHSGTCPLRETP